MGSGEQEKDAFMSYLIEVVAFFALWKSRSSRPSFL